MRTLINVEVLDKNVTCINLLLIFFSLEVFHTASYELVLQRKFAFKWLLHLTEKLNRNFFFNIIWTHRIIAVLSKINRICNCAAQDMFLLIEHWLLKYQFH